MLQQDHEHHELKSPYCSFILSGVPGGCQKSKHSPTVPRNLLQNPEAEGKHLFFAKKGGGGVTTLSFEGSERPIIWAIKVHIFAKSPWHLGWLSKIADESKLSIKTRLNSLDQTRPLGVILVNQPCVSPWLRFLSSPSEFLNFPAFWRWDS